MSSLVFPIVLRWSVPKDVIVLFPSIEEESYYNSLSVEDRLKYLSKHVAIIYNIGQPK